MKTFQRLFTTTAEEKNIERAHVDEPSSRRTDLLERRRPPPLAPAEDRAVLALEREQDGRSRAGPEGRASASTTASTSKPRSARRAPSTPTTSPRSANSASATGPTRRACSRASRSAGATSTTPRSPSVGRHLERPPGRILAARGRQPARIREGIERSQRAGLLDDRDGRLRVRRAAPGHRNAAGVAKTITLPPKRSKTRTSRPTRSSPVPRTGAGLDQQRRQGRLHAGGGLGRSDTFTFSAADASSHFPESPQVATVSVEVTSSTQPAVSIEGAPASMQAGSSVQLTAKVVNDSPTVTWGAPLARSRAKAGTRRPRKSRRAGP